MAQQGLEALGGRPVQGPEAEGVMASVVEQCSTLCTGKHHEMQETARCRF